jgi:hypothetical protein
MADKVITFESYYDPMLAYIIHTRLADNDIACFIADDNMLWAKPYYNQLLGGVKIKVFENDLERCREILATNVDPSEQDHFETDPENNTNNSNIACSFCASTNVRYGGATAFKFHLLSVFVSVLFFVPLYFRNAWHCFNCHHDF